MTTWEAVGAPTNNLSSCDSVTMTNYLLRLWHPRIRARRSPLRSAVIRSLAPIEIGLLRPLAVRRTSFPFWILSAHSSPTFGRLRNRADLHQHTHHRRPHLLRDIAFVAEPRAVLARSKSMSTPISRPLQTSVPALRMISMRLPDLLLVLQLRAGCRHAPACSAPDRRRTVGWPPAAASSAAGLHRKIV